MRQYCQGLRTYTKNTSCFEWRKIKHWMELHSMNQKQCCGRRWRTAAAAAATTPVQSSRPVGAHVQYVQSTRVLRLTPPAQCSGAQDLGSGCRWAFEWRLVAAVSVDLLFYDGLEHVRYIVGGQNKNSNNQKIQQRRVSHISQITYHII